MVQVGYFFAFLRCQEIKNLHLLSEMLRVLAAEREINAWQEIIVPKMFNQGGRPVGFDRNILWDALMGRGMFSC